MKYRLKDSIIAQINGVPGCYRQVAKAIRYGSGSKGNDKTGSDMDLRLEGGHDHIMDD